MQARTWREIGLHRRHFGVDLLQKGQRGIRWSSSKIICHGIVHQESAQDSGKDTVAHNCHGNNKYLTAKLKLSRQYQIPHGKTKMLKAKQKAHGKIKNSRQNQKAHGKTKNSRQKQKTHSKTKKLTAKPKTRER